MTPKFMPKSDRYLDDLTLASLSRHFSPEIVEALTDKFRILVESFDLHQDDEAKRLPKLKDAVETILRELTLERMPHSTIWAGYFGLRLERLEEFDHFLERTIRKTPKPRTGRKNWKIHTLALNVGRVLALK